MSDTHPLTTTAFDLPGYQVKKNFGVVRGIIVRSRSVIGNIGASLQTIVGGNITVYTSLCERTTEIGPGITEVLCYGTAVYVEPSN